MRWSILAGLTLLVACGASQVQSQKLKDGSWSFTCQLSMDECVRRAQDECRNQRYRIIEGTSETRLRDAPPFEKAYHTSRLHIVCTDDGATVLLSVSSANAQTPAAPVCASGETRACIGPGACKGGQACLPDGKGFGSCDCGPAASAPPAQATTPPVTSPADSVPGTPPTAEQPATPTAPTP